MRTFELAIVTTTYIAWRAFMGATEAVLVLLPAANRVVESWARDVLFRSELRGDVS